MIRALVKKNLLLFLFLFSGYIQMSAHSSTEYAVCSSINSFNDASNISIVASQHGKDIIVKSFSSGRERENNRLSIIFFENEEDDDELSFSKNWLTNNYFTLAFTQSLDNFSIYVKKILILYKRLAYASSFLYLLFQIFLI